MTIDVAAAVAANDKLLGLSGLPLNTRRRTVAMLLAWQEAHSGFQHVLRVKIQRLQNRF